MPLLALLVSTRMKRRTRKTDRNVLINGRGIAFKTSCKTSVSAMAASTNIVSMTFTHCLKNLRGPWYARRKATSSESTMTTTYNEVVYSTPLVSSMLLGSAKARMHFTRSTTTEAMTIVPKV